MLLLPTSSSWVVLLHWCEARDSRVGLEDSMPSVVFVSVLNRLYSCYRRDFLICGLCTFIQCTQSRAIRSLVGQVKTVLFSFMLLFTPPLPPPPPSSVLILLLINPAVLELRGSIMAVLGLEDRLSGNLDCFYRRRNRLLFLSIVRPIAKCVC